MKYSIIPSEGAFGLLEYGLDSYPSVLDLAPAFERAMAAGAARGIRVIIEPSTMGQDIVMVLIHIFSQFGPVRVVVDSGELREAAARIVEKAEREARRRLMARQGLMVEEG